MRRPAIAAKGVLLFQILDVGLTLERLGDASERAVQRRDASGVKELAGEEDPAPRSFSRKGDSRKFAESYPLAKGIDVYANVLRGLFSGPETVGIGFLRTLFLGMLLQVGLRRY